MRARSAVERRTGRYAARAGRTSPSPGRASRRTVFPDEGAPAIRGSAAIASYFPVALERVATALVIFVLGCVTAGIGVFSSDPHALRLQVPRPVYWVVGAAACWFAASLLVGAVRHRPESPRRVPLRGRDGSHRPDLSSPSELAHVREVFHPLNADQFERRFRRRGRGRRGCLRSDRSLRACLPPGPSRATSPWSRVTRSSTR